jgi:hypothetical protein
VAAKELQVLRLRSTTSRSAQDDTREGWEGVKDAAHYRAALPAPSLHIVMCNNLHIPRCIMPTNLAIAIA